MGAAVSLNDSHERRSIQRQVALLLSGRWSAIASSIDPSNRYVIADTAPRYWILGKSGFNREGLQAEHQASRSA